MKKLFLAITILLIIGCTSQSASESGLKKGIAGFVPKNYPNSSSDDWLSFYNEVPLLGELFGVYASWTSDSLVEQVSTGNQLGVTPVIAIGFNYEVITDGYFIEHNKSYQETILSVVREFKPQYLAVGVEVSRLHEHNPGEFNGFVEMYKEVYDKIKTISPGTKVFTIFQLENMKGAAKMTGRQHPPQWNIISLFGDKLDLVGFTAYPFLEYESPSELPSDYYSEIAEYTNKPVAFTEMGWPSNSTIIGGSEQEQVTFLEGVVNATSQLNFEFIIYSFLHDFEAPVELFSTIALKYSDGSEKQIYQSWKSI